MMFWIVVLGLGLLSEVANGIPFEEMEKGDMFVPLEHSSDESFVFHSTGIVKNLEGSQNSPPSSEEETDGTLVINREGTEIGSPKNMRGKSAFKPCQGSSCGNVVVSTGFAKTGKYSGGGQSSKDSTQSDNVVRIE